MAGTSREISSVMTSAANNYNTRLDSSVRIKTRIRTEVTYNRIRANAHNSGNYTRLATMLAGLIAPRLRYTANIVARHAITLIMRLGT